MSVTIAQIGRHNRHKHYHANPIRKRKPIKKQDEPEYWAIHNVADEQQEEFQQAWFAGVSSIQDLVVLQAIQDAFARGDLGTTLEEIPWDQFPTELSPFRDEFINVLQQGANATWEFLPDDVQAELRFDLMNPRSVEFIRDHTGELITQVTEETREAIAGVIDRAFTDGMHPRTSARHIRNTIGLTNRQASAVDNLRRRLREDNVPWPDVMNQTERYANDLLRQRSENIARTETLRAANAGQELLWLQAAEEGLINEARTLKEWIVTPDDRLCEFCEPLDGQTQPLDGFFTSEIGNVEVPPLHPQCRCAMGLQFLDG